MLRGSIQDLASEPHLCTGETSGLPENVWVSFSWCNTNCPGFAMTWTDAASLKLWLRPLVAFLAPSIIFCLNIPRRRKIKTPLVLFPRNLGSFPENVLLIFKIPLSALIVTADLILWLMVTICVAGPLLLSGVYEAILDARLLRYLDSRVRTNSLTVRERAHILTIMLLGNLDLDPTWNHARSFIFGLPHDSLRRRFSSQTSSTHVSPSARHAGSSKHPSLGSISESGTLCGSTHGDYDENTRSSIDNIKWRLTAALTTQVDFGSAVGAAVVFYSAAFVYTIIEISNNYSDGSFSHELAFGMLWMTVPHIAIVSNLLIADNNPSIWEGLIDIRAGPNISFSETSTKNDQAPIATMFEWFRRKLDVIYQKLTSSSYDSRYKTAWMWNRGSSKALWIARTHGEYPNLAALEKEVLRFEFTGWIFSLLAPSLLLLLLPCFLGGLVSYTSPLVGISCRSLAILLYGCSQTLLIVLWLLDYRFWRRDKNSHVKWTSSNAKSLSIFDAAWYFFFILGVFTGFVAGIMGTVFQLTSLFSNCLCFLPIRYWSTRFSNPEAQIPLSAASSSTIWYAEHYWLATGIAAAVFLISMTYLGWWYQRRMREQFKGLIRKIDSVDLEDLKENEDGMDEKMGQLQGNIHGL